VACMPCPAGFVSSIPGGSNCTQCAAGFYVNATSSTCVACDVGFFAPAGSTACHACPAGYSCPRADVMPVPCPGGFVCAAGTSQPVPCSAGFFCPPQSVQQLKCPSHDKCPAGSDLPSPSSIPGWAIACIVLSSLCAAAILGSVIVCIYRRRVQSDGTDAEHLSFIPIT